MLWAIYLLIVSLCATGTYQEGAYQEASFQEKVESESVEDPLDTVQQHLADVKLDWNNENGIETIKLTISVPAGHAIVSTLDKKSSLRPWRTRAFRFLGKQKNVKDYVIEVKHAGPELSDGLGNHVSLVPEGYFVVRRTKTGIVVTYVSEEKRESIARWVISTIAVEDAISLIPEFDDESWVTGFVRVEGFKQILASPFEKMPGVGR